MTQLQQVVEHSWGCNPNFKYHYDRKTREYIGAPHQFNCTYFSAVGESPRRYLLARAIQFWTPGVPMVYYVGLLAGKNDFEVGLWATLEMSVALLPLDRKCKYLPKMPLVGN